ncbi:MAG: hemolysin family protein [Opitutaceae bacterium]|jgi:CBS domain containing-hemolysin-like protein|nr:hemolysin family protein [Opitutaceae bacterium]
MIAFITAIVLTLGCSFFCSVFEAMILSTTMAEIESLKQTRRHRGEILEKLKTRTDETIPAILTLNTIANTLGSVIIGGIATRLFGDAILGVVSVAITLSILIFSEVIPKNIGVVHRRRLQPLLAYPLLLICRALRPMTYLCNLVVRLVVRQPAQHTSSGQEIILLAQRGARQGTLSANESSLITNALSLDDVRVDEIMTPRTVVTALPKKATIADVFRDFPNLPFGRMPVYGKNIDDIAGIARRRDLLKAKANDRDADLVEKHMQEAHFIPETITAANALQVFLKTHQQMLVVVDEFGSTSGVLTMEDVIEHLLGREIFEKDDVAVDMRELARAKLRKAKK